MKAYRSVLFREKSRNPCIDQWATLSPDADPCSDDEDRREREKRVKIYAKYVAKNRPIQFIGEDDES